MLASAANIWSYYANSYETSPDLSMGQNFTTGANDTDGTAITLLSALSYDVHFVRISVNCPGASTADGNAAGDLLVDPAGGTSWSSKIDDLVIGFSGVSNQRAWNAVYNFPLYIKAGTSIGWRAKTVHTADLTQGQVLVEVFGQPSRPELIWCGNGVETLGISDSKGTGITPGNNAWGSWTSVGSTTVHHFKSVQYGFNGTDATSSTLQYYFQVGTNSVQLAGSGQHTALVSTSESAEKNSTGYPIPCNIPAGTQMQMRARCSSAPETTYVAVYGVY